MYRPTIVAGLGYSGASAQLHTGMKFILLSISQTGIDQTPVPPFIPAVVLTRMSLLDFLFSRHRHIPQIIHSHCCLFLWQASLERCLHAHSHSHCYYWYVSLEFD